MPVCSICNYNFMLVATLILHLKFKHKISTTSGVFKCIDEGCLREFRGAKALRDHFRKKHGNQYRKRKLVNVVETPHSVIGNNGHLTNVAGRSCGPIIDDHVSSTSVSEEALVTPENENNETVNDEVFTSNVQLESATFVAQLYATGNLTRSQVQHIVEMVSNFFGPLLSSLKTDVLEAMKTLEASQRKSIERKFESLENPFESLGTDYLRRKYLENNGYLINPLEYVIGTRFENKMVCGKLVLTPTVCVGHFIPLRKVLERMLSLPGVLEKTCDYIDKLSSCDIISNFIQCLLWKEKLNFLGKKNVLPLFIYFDDFETGNALGSHAGIHKLGVVYVSIPCLPPEFRSVLENIILVLLFHSSDRVMFGNRATFNILLEELKFLENEGITVNTQNGCETIYFSIGIVCGDNLGLHSILGFIESFSSLHPCRFCKISRNELLVSSNLQNQTLRNRQNYDEDVAVNNQSETGIKENCVFNEINSFHVTKNASVDLMHDLLEGVCIYDVVNILRHFVLNCKIFTLETLNSRIQFLDVGSNEKRNRPPVITMEKLKKGNLNMSASQMLFLVRYLGIAVGDLIPPNDNVWDLYLTLRKIIDLLTAPSFQVGCDILLNTLIQEHNELFLKVFDEPLKPKYHFMCHYPMVMRQSGPLVHLSNIRFEAKHNIFKTASYVTTSRKNLTYTLTLRHQLKQAERILAQRGLGSATTSVGPGEEIVVSSHTDFRHISDILPSESFEMSYVPRWVCIKGTIYKPGMILVIDILDHFPVFGSITTILVNRKETVAFVCKELETLSFNEHVYAYEVKSTKKLVCVLHDNIVEFIPTFLVTLGNNTLCVPLRNSL